MAIIVALRYFSSEAAPKTDIDSFPECR